MFSYKIKNYVYIALSAWFLFTEELLGSGEAVWFSPDGSQLVYASFDDSNVGEIVLNAYGGAGQMVSDAEAPTYPKISSLRYPKVGQIHVTYLFCCVQF